MRKLLLVYVSLLGAHGVIAVGGGLLRAAARLLLRHVRLAIPAKLRLILGVCG